MNQNKFPIILGMIFLLSLNFISAISITDVSSSPGEVVPGQIVDISIEIENIFDYDVENLKVKLDLSEAPFAPHQSSSEKYLDGLRDGDEEDFDFELIVLPATASGIYKIPVEINYYKNGDDEEQTIEDLISITVNSEPEIKVFLEDSAVLIKGKENTFSIRLINSGLADVKFVYIVPSEVGGIKFLSEKEQYVGDIDSDDFDSVEYKIHINKDSPNTINMPVILKFKDATNKEFTETENVVLKTYSLKEAQELGLVKKSNYWIYIVPVVVIVAWIVWRKIKKARKKKREGGGR